jgi:hypothetical protein
MPVLLACRVLIEPVTLYAGSIKGPLTPDLLFIISRLCFRYAKWRQDAADKSCCFYNLQADGRKTARMSINVLTF